MIDYRNTLYCEPYKNILNEKENVSLKYGTTINFYNKIKNNDPLKKQFRNMYNNKCCYCGISNKIIENDNFEIDHFIPQAYADIQTSPIKNINSLNNLVLSCRRCNRSKQDFPKNISSDIYSDLSRIHPDNETISNIFLRDHLYNIIISDEYKSNHIINEFYIKLKLNSSIRKLDFLILNMKGLSHKIDDLTIKNHISSIILILLECRNTFNPSTSNQNITYACIQ